MFDDAELRIQCPHCGHELVKPIGWFKGRAEFALPCGHNANLEQIGQAIQEVENTLRELADTVGGTTKRLEIKF